MPLTEADLTSLALTLKLAAVTTAWLLLLSVPLAWWLSRGGGWARRLVLAGVALPLVLPPTVLGFYLLLVLAPDGPGGWLANLLGSRSLAFTFEGLVLASIVYSLPFAVLPLRSALAAIPEDCLEAAATLGASPLRQLTTIALPLAWPGVMAAAVLAFAHTVGEFGVALMIGGSIPGETRVLSIAIYEQVELMNYGAAHWLSATLVLASLAALLLLRPEARARQHA